MRRALSFLGFALLIFVAISFSLHFLFKFVPVYPVQKLEKGWTVIYHNEQYINTNLERLSNQLNTSFSKGDTITLNLDKSVNYSEVPFPYLIFKTQFCGYRVYLDGKLIASENSDGFFDNKFVGTSYHQIPLPKELSGKKLSIKLFVTENNTRVDLMSPVIGDYDDVYRSLLHPTLYPAFTGVFMILFGIIFLLISLFFYVRSSGVAPQVLTSLLSISLGIWIVTSYDSLDFVMSPSIATTIEYLSMFSFLPLIYLLISSLHKRYNNMVIMFLAYTSTAFEILFYILHKLDMVHINQFQKPFFFMSIMGFIMLFIYAYKDFKVKRRNSSTVILMVGLLVLSLCLLSYVFVSISKSVVDYRQSPILCFLIPSGCLFFVITQLLNHFIFMTRSFAQRDEYLSLTKIAYVDNLTGVPNRASCDSKLAEIDDTEDDFCILSLDLNGLKEVNDNAGHPAGDRLLKSFSAALLEVFSSKGDCFRVGGDEFIVVFSKIEASELDLLIKELEARLKKLDEEDPEINHSVSYGYCFRSETLENDTHSVQMLADARMYEFKRRFYSHMTRI
ncbi:MAG: diguanylate cyclase [Butyrivibrio sp.]|nr:diguanylate cyclase [Butyrivibrio sp.]